MLSSSTSTPTPLAPSSTLVGRGSGYDTHDDSGGDDLEGEIPLLRRDGSHGSGYSMPRASVPGAYNDDPVSENNIRYGRIPQRVPRRYKTVKKVE